VLQALRALGLQKWDQAASQPLDHSNLRLVNHISMSHDFLGDDALIVISEQLSLPEVLAQELLQRIRHCEQQGIYEVEGQPRLPFSWFLTIGQLLPPSGPLLNVKALLHPDLDENLENSGIKPSAVAVHLRKALQGFAEHGVQAQWGVLNAALTLGDLRPDLEKYRAALNNPLQSQRILDAITPHDDRTLGELGVFASEPSSDDASLGAIVAALEAHPTGCGLDLPLYLLLNPNLKCVFGVIFSGSAFVVDRLLCLPSQEEPDHGDICRQLCRSAMTEDVALETLRYASTLVQRLLIALYHHVLPMQEAEMCMELFNPGLSPFDDIWHRLAVVAGGELCKAVRRIRWHNARECRRVVRGV